MRVISGVFSWNNRQVSVSRTSVFQGTDAGSNRQREAFMVTTMTGAWSIIIGSSRGCAKARVQLKLLLIKRVVP